MIPPPHILKNSVLNTRSHTTGGGLLWFFPCNSQSAEWAFQPLIGETGAYCSQLQGLPWPPSCFMELGKSWHLLQVRWKLAIVNLLDDLETKSRCSCCELIVGYLLAEEKVSQLKVLRTNLQGVLILTKLCGQDFFPFNARFISCLLLPLRLWNSWSHWNKKRSRYQRASVSGTNLKILTGPIAHGLCTEALTYPSNPQQGAIGPIVSLNVFPGSHFLLPQSISLLAQRTSSGFLPPYWNSIRANMETAFSIIDYCLAWNIPIFCDYPSL